MIIFGQISELETDQGIDASIAPYQADVREAILQASQHPEVLSALQKTQSQTVESFHSIISGFDRKKQAWFYTITRYPELMHTLSTLPGKTDKAAIYKLLPNQDADLKEAAWQLYDSKKKDLIKLDNINIAAKQDFDKTVQNLSAPARSAFEKLYNMPDVLTLLTNNIDLTTRLGEHYKENPTALNNRLASIHDSLIVQDQYEITAYKKQMADDPKARDELSQAAKDYAKDNDYDVPAQQYDDADNENYYANPYSYWFGYPGWYSDPLWYPGSFWFDTGLYFGIGGFGIGGMPGYGFSSWFFGGGHYNHYPNLYRQFGNYYHNNIAENRVMGSSNRGFMGVANTHFNANGGNQLNRQSSRSIYSRVNRQSTQTNRGNATRVNANSYHSQSWSSFGGRSNGIRSGGGFRGGGGSHGGGGSRGGGGGSRH
ncbi:MAG: hypothetical protein P4L51_22540 [Puia sp.]|nr:hypothetical protein [Puia sp.]